MPEKTVQKESGKKPAPSKEPKPQQEVVVQIPLSELHPFPDHPFQVREDGKRTIITRAEQSYGRVRCRAAGCQGISFSISSWVGDLPR